MSASLERCAVLYAGQVLLHYKLEAFKQGLNLCTLQAKLERERINKPLHCRMVYPCIS
jgi:hypothetical protein